MDVLDQPNIGGGVAEAEVEELTPELVRKRRGQLRIIFDRFIRNRVAVVGMVVLLLIIALAVFAPLITHKTATYDPATTIPPTGTGCEFCGPSLLHPLGTDELGRDVLARVLFGARVSLIVGSASMLVAITLGASIGAIAGFYGGWIDNILMRLVDAALATPYLLLLLVLSVLFSNGSVLAVVILIALISWADTSRIVRGQFLSLKEREFLLATRTLGANGWRLILRHLLPNSAGPIIVQATLLVGTNIITESVLSFFGYGLAPPQSSWGSMLAQSQDFLFTDPVLLYAPGLMIVITVLCFNLMGDGLRDALDPYMTER